MFRTVAGANPHPVFRDLGVRPRWSRSARVAHSGDHGERVPDEVIERAKAAFGRRSTAPVARIVSDSSDEDAQSGERRLRFEHGPVRVDLSVTAIGERRDVRGRVEPPQFRVELELDGSAVTVAKDATSGDFAFEAIPRGVTRLRLVSREGGDALTTDWFLA